ncbi:MAG TPA: hypothetical protein VJ785_14735 [Anaerolineales bacterium]|nr:hypothetical protein [Anaerolineales bacterium]
MKSDEVEEYAKRLTDLARQLNTFAGSLKAVRAEQKSKPAIREEQAEYLAITLGDLPDPLFNEDDLHWLNS